MWPDSDAGPWVGGKDTVGDVECPWVVLECLDKETTAVAVVVGGKTATSCP